MTLSQRIWSSHGWKQLGDLTPPPKCRVLALSSAPSPQGHPSSPPEDLDLSSSASWLKWGNQKKLSDFSLTFQLLPFLSQFSVVLVNWMSAPSVLVLHQDSGWGRTMWSDIRQRDAVGSPSSTPMSCQFSSNCLLKSEPQTDLVKSFT